MSNKLTPALQKSIKAELSRLSCPVHKKHPQISFTSQGFNVKCCCDDFRDTVNKKAEEVVRKATAKYITGMFKGLK